MYARVQVAVVALTVILLAVTTSPVAADERPACDRHDSNSVCQANITVFVYLDSQPDAVPLTGARVTFITPTGDHIQRISGRTGLLSFASIDILPNEEASFHVEYPADFYDMRVVPCTNSPTLKRIDANSFGPLRSAHVNFCARPYRPKG
jgi:hypothetical protein